MIYRLADTMLQHLEKSLIKFHELFQGGRCQAWQLEELLAKAIRSDFSVAEKVTWKGNGHDIDADIIINDENHLQVKSGAIKKNKLILSGHRLGRFNKDFQEIKKFLNQSKYMIISVPYKNKKDSRGISHVYKIFYIDPSILSITGDFESHKKIYVHVNSHDVHMSLIPSMSWQVWWDIPLDLIEKDTSRDIEIT